MGCNCNNCDILKIETVAKISRAILFQKKDTCISSSLEISKLINKNNINFLNTNNLSCD